MRISIWPKLTLVSLSFLLMGQSCSVSFGNPGRSDGGVFRSDDHGKTWVQKNYVGVQKKQSVYLDEVSARTLVADPTQSDHLYLGTAANGIWETTNGGDQWRATSLRTGEYNCLTFDSLNPQIMYTAAGSVVVKSLDGGQKWQVMYTESQPGQVVTCVIVNPGIDRQVWALTSAGKLIRSDDFGQRWTLVSQLTPMVPRLMHFDSDGTLFIFSRDAGIWRGDQQGTAWTKITPPLNTFPGATDLRAVAIDRSGWYIATARGLLRTTNRGVSWSEIPTLVTPGSIPFQNVTVNPQNSQEIFITAGTRLLHTINGGSAWSVSTLPTSRVPVQLKFDNNRGDRLFFATFKVKN